MARSGKRWTVYERDGRPIYLTRERWQHIIDEDNHISTTHPVKMKKLTVDHITYSYDEQADVMYISFYPGEKATTSVLLTDHILLRLNYSERRKPRLAPRRRAFDLPLR